MLDVGRALGISQTTVSLALRNNPQIPAHRRVEIQATARKLGYTPNPAATSLAHFKWTSRSMPIQAELAWLNFWPNPDQMRSIPLLDAKWRGAVQAAQSLGYEIQEFHCNGSISPSRLRSILVTRRIQGILLPPQRPTVPREQFDFDWSEFSLVRFGHSVAYPPAHVVSHSQARDCLVAFGKVMEKGYRRIGLIISNSVRTFRLFDAGYFKGQALLKEEDQIPVLILEDSPQPAREILGKIKAWMDKYQPDAILSGESNIKALLTAAGYRVPGDVAVASFSTSNSDVDSGIFENPEEVGRTAANTLVSLIQRNEKGIPEYPQEILLRGKWMEGTSLPSVCRNGIPALPNLFT